MPGLGRSVVDVFLSTVNQVPGQHAGPAGRLTELIDCQIRRYSGRPERVVVEPRNGFASLSTVEHSYLTGQSSSAPWALPELVGALDDQLVAVAGQIPRVFTGSSYWTEYTNKRVLPNKLSESVYHTSDHTIQAPDSAWLAGVTCFVWTETTYNDAGLPITGSWIGFKSDSGTWITVPRLLYQGSATVKTRAQVVSDGTQFWVVWNSNSSGNKLNFATYDTNGAKLGSTVTRTQFWAESPGYWDLTYQGGNVLLVQTHGTDATTDGHVELTHMYWTGSAIAHVENVDTTVHCNGPCAWLTNDLNNQFAYLATTGLGEGGVRYWGYEVDPGLIQQTHEYDTLWTAQLPDSLTGYVTSGLDLFLSYTKLADGTISGPANDPASRATFVISALRSGGSASLVRVTNSVCQVSRAFKRDNDYYVATYYQSGSGLTLQGSTQTVTLDESDYMYGAPSQNIQVVPGDYVTGATFGVVGNFIQASSGQTATAVGAGDTVSVVVSDGSITYGFVTSGTNLLKWTFAAGAIPANVLVQGGRLVMSGTTGVTGANGTWDIVGGWPGGGPQYVLTLANSATGSTLTPGAFGSAGTYTIQAMVGYQVPSGLIAAVPVGTETLFTGGSVTVSGAATPGNNGTFTIQRVVNTTNLSTGLLSNKPAVWVNQTTQSTQNQTFVAQVTPTVPKRWHFQHALLDSSYDGQNLFVSGNARSENQPGPFVITGASGTNIGTGGADADGTAAELFGSPMPTVTVDLPLGSAYTFRFLNVTFDATYIGALIQVANAAHPANNGIYKITFIDPSDSGHHTVIAEPTNGKTDQVNENLGATGATVVIQIPALQGSEFQPCWFLTPLTADQAQVGCWERGLAYADWRYEGQSGLANPNLFPLAVSSVVRTSQGLTDVAVMLPYRAKSFTAGQAVTTPQGTATALVLDTLENTVGLKRFTFQQDTGTPYQAFNELAIPGPLGASFTESGFHENGINLGPELPFIVSQEQDTSVFGVSPGPIVLQVTYEVTDENGDRVWSYPSPALSFNLLAPNNTYTVSGRLPLPLRTDGTPDPGWYGISNRQSLSICLYRTATVNGVPTTQVYKITNDLNPNGRRSGPTTGQGFTFPDNLTWTYRDQSLDTAIIDQEALYTTRGLLPRYPSPPFSSGDVWENRSWQVGYDGAVWLAGDKTEGDATWYFPGFRITCPDTILTFSRMEQYGILGCARSMWYIPAQSLPNNTGTSGSLPTPSPLPFQNGTTGKAVTISSGVVYASTAGGVWLITRDLKNVWLSEPIKDKLTQDMEITDLAVDKLQRVMVVAKWIGPAKKVFVYDPVPNAWYEWRLPSTPAKLTTWNGVFAYNDNDCVLYQDGTSHADDRLGDVSGIAPDLTLAGISFAQARAVKRVWEMQLVGEYRGPHRLNAVLSYPDDYSTSPTTFGPFPVLSDPGQYLWAINPAIEEAGQYVLRVFADFIGIDSPGDSFALELISCEVGVDRKPGLFKRPAGQRIVRN